MSSNLHAMSEDDLVNVSVEKSNDVKLICCICILRKIYDLLSNLGDMIISLQQVTRLVPKGEEGRVKFGCQW